MKIKGFSLTLRKKGLSKNNPTGELKALVLRVSYGGRNSRRPYKSLGIDLLPTEWDATTQSLLSNAKHRLGAITYDAYEERIESIKSRFYSNLVALQKGEKSIEQAFSTVIDINTPELVLPVVEAKSINKNEINYFKDYCKVLNRTPENFTWTYFTPESIETYVEHLRKVRKVSESSITSYVKTLSKFFNEGKRRGFIRSNTIIPKDLTKGYAHAGGRKRFEHNDVFKSILNIRDEQDALAICFILLAIHFCGTDRFNWMTLNKSDFFDEDAHSYTGKGLKFVRFKRKKEENTESIGNSYFSMNYWYIDNLIKLFKHLDRKRNRKHLSYDSSFLIGSFTIKPNVDTIKSWYKRRRINEKLAQLNTESERVINHQNTRATFEFYASKAQIDEQTLAFMQGRSIRGSVKHYAVMESRLNTVAELHAKAMDKFKMNQLTAALFLSVQSKDNSFRCDVPNWNSLEEVISDWT